MVSHKRYNLYVTIALQHYSRQSIKYIKVIPYFYFKVTNARNLYIVFTKVRSIEQLYLLFSVTNPNPGSRQLCRIKSQTFKLQYT